MTVTAALTAFLADLVLMTTSFFGYVTDAATTVIGSPILFIGLGLGIVGGMVRMIKK